MPAITGQLIVQDALSLLNVYLPGESPSNNDAQLARRFLNDLLSAMSQQVSMIPVIARERFDLVADKGGEDDPYTIGDGGDFDTPKPANQNSIVSANLILTATTPEVRVPLGIYTDDAYNANQLPGMSNSQPTGLYYSPTYDDDLGSICLWPVPNTATNDLELFIQQAVPQFASLSTTYYVPDGWPRMLKYNLAEMLQDPFGRTLGQASQRIAANSLSAVKRSNLKLSDLPTDAMFATAIRRTLFNINSGQ
jgi:hypothetical protein